MLSDCRCRPDIGFEAGDALDFKPRGGCKVLHLGSRKNLPSRFVRQDEELGGGADAGTTPRRTACEILYLHSIQDMKFRKS